MAVKVFRINGNTAIVTGGVTDISTLSEADIAGMFQKQATEAQAKFGLDSGGIVEMVVRGEDGNISKSLAHSQDELNSLIAALPQSAANGHPVDVLWIGPLGSYQPGA